MSTVVVLNPDASQARRDLQRVRAALADSPLLAGGRVIPCQGWEGGREAAEEAARSGARLVVAAGGDGTVNSVVNGIMAGDGRRPVLGVLPLGTGNDLARTLGIPADLDDALEVLERRIVRRMDVLRSEGDGGRYCANVSAAGFSGQVDEDVSDESKESWGPLAYLRSALANAAELRTYDVVVEIDGGEEIVEASAVNLVVANGRYAGGGVPVAPDAKLDDGFADVVVLEAGPIPTLGLVVARMAAGRHREHELVRVVRGRRVRISSTPAMPFNVDGELVGSGAIEFEVLRRELPVLVGRDRPPAV